MQFPILGPSSLPVVVAQPDEIHANRTASVLGVVMTDTEHATFGLNKEEPEDKIKLQILIYLFQQVIAITRTVHFQNFYSFQSIYL